MPIKGLEALKARLSDQWKFPKLNDRRRKLIAENRLDKYTVFRDYSVIKDIQNQINSLKLNLL